MPHSAMQMFLALGAVLSAHVAALKFQKPECTDRMRGGFSRNIMRHHCGADLTSFSSDVTESAVACEAASTPFLHRALANKMFSQCGDACVYDFEQPEKIEFVYNEEKKCYAEKRNGGCSAQDPVAVENVKQHKSQLCEAELCHPFIPDLTENIMLRYCGEAGANGQDHSPDAKGCEETYTAKVQTALANHMFKHCGAWCLFDYDEPDKVSYAWDDKQQCWKQGGCVGHPEQQYAVERRNKACEYTTTTTTMTTTSTSTTTTSTITSTSSTTTSTSTVTSTSTTTTSTVTSTSTTTTSTITSTSTTTTSTTTSTTTTSTSTVTSTSTTTTSTSTVTTTTTTETTTSTTSTSTSTTTTSTSTETITTTSTSTSTTSTSTVTSTSTTTTKTSTTTSTSTTSTSTTSTSTQTSTTTTVTETTTSTITSTSTVTSTSTSTTSTSTTTCQPPVGFLTDDLTKSHCSTLITNFVDRSTHVSSCDGATTPFVQRALANHMFAHCGAWCLYDFDFPEKISYAWDKEKQCFEPGGKCQGHKEQAVVVQRKGAMCEVETPLCYPVAAKLTPAVMYRYCDKLSTNGEDRSPEAKGCHDSYTPYVQRSLANKMFSHCGAWCLYDFDKPDTVAYSWNEAEKCWHRGSGCLGHPEQKLATERKKDFCEAELCIPVQSILSETLMLSYCNDLGKTEDRTPHAKSCDSALSGQVHKALANKMFSHCGAWCIFDFDEPDKVAFGWNPQGKCWKKSDSCGPQLERDVVVKRKSQFCKA